MKTIIAFLSFVSILHFSGVAQHQLSARTNPLYLFIPNRTLLPVGIEYAYGNFGVQAEQLLLVRKNTSLASQRNIRYTRTNVQLRYYLDLFPSEGREFIGIHGTFRDHTYFRTFGSYIDENGVTGNYRNSRINATNRGFYVVSGIQRRLTSFLDIEFTAGLGTRRLSVSHEAETFEPGPIDAVLTEDFEENWREGSRDLGAILLQFRFIYTLLRK